MIQRSQQKGHSSAQEGFQSGAEQDGHHDEGFQLSLRETAVHDARTRELQSILDSSEAVQPQEQNLRAEFGVGLVLRYEDGSLDRFVLDGYSLPDEHPEGSSRPHTLSVSSPLGRALIGSRQGEKRAFRMGTRNVSVMVEKIVAPSKVDDISNF
ncbi:MAG: GreA/GreB family elongation factor [Candidatus Taylorbacteria bacterium]|nr:GreA/GreB family elongation factor [Candidatus Taylorbacteria bacterium]